VELSSIKVAMLVNVDMNLLMKLIQAAQTIKLENIQGSPTHLCFRQCVGF
jgi:hypothetical protein